MRQLFQTIKPLNPGTQFHGIIFDKDNTLEPRDTWRQVASTKVVTELTGKAVHQNACKFLIGISEALGNDLLNATFSTDYRVNLISKATSLDSPLSEQTLQLIEEETLHFAERFRARRKQLETEAITRGEIKTYPGVNTFLELLANKDIPFGIATQSKSSDREILNQRIFFGLTAIQSLTKNNSWVTSDEVKNPKPDLYLEAVNRLNTAYFPDNPKAYSQFFAVEDSNSGVISALSAGLPVIHIVHGDGDPLNTKLEQLISFKAFGIAGVQAIAEKYLLI